MHTAETQAQLPTNGPGSVARKLARDFVRKHCRQPSMYELDQLCRQHVEPTSAPVSRRTGKKLFRFAW